jgi:hypothetical protein
VSVPDNRSRSNATKWAGHSSAAWVAPLRRPIRRARRAARWRQGAVRPRRRSPETPEASRRRALNAALPGPRRGRPVRGTRPSPDLTCLMRHVVAVADSPCLWMGARYWWARVFKCCQFWGLGGGAVTVRARWEADIACCQGRVPR